MKRSLRSRRLGSLLVCVLVCLGIATSIMLTAIHSSLRARRQIVRELQMEQTRWLIDAGLQRAVKMVASDPNYMGETWNVVPTIDSHADATIEIKIVDAGLNKGKIRLSVSAAVHGKDLNSQPTRSTDSLILDRTQAAANRSNSSTTATSTP